MVRASLIHSAVMGGLVLCGVLGWWVIPLAAVWVGVALATDDDEG